MEKTVKILFAGFILLVGVGLIARHYVLEQQKLADRGSALQQIAANRLSPEVFQSHCGRGTLKPKTGGGVIVSYPGRDVDVVFDRDSVTYLSTYPARLISLDDAVSRLDCRP